MATNDRFRLIPIGDVIQSKHRSTGDRTVNTSTIKTDILIVGAGFAGASTACHLSHRFGGSILVVDKEELPGFHASGRNASLVLQCTLPLETRRLTVESRRHYEVHREEIGFRQCGSILMGSKEQLARLCHPAPPQSEFLEPSRARARVPALQGHQFEAALWTPSDGTMDIARLLQFYLQGARSRGVDVRLDCRILEMSRQSPFQVTTSRGRIEAKFIVNAAGAWASEISQLAGASSLPLFPLKRHLFVLDEIGSADERSPFVWNLEKNFYFRPESGGLLFSVCDEERCQSLEPTINDETSEQLAEVIWSQLPALREAVQRRVWSCFRTRTPDDQFVIGWDPVVENYLWVAGLGGHGMGASWRVGEVAALLLLGDSPEDSHPFRPARFASSQQR